MQKIRQCMHEHWKNCLDFSEAHIFVQHLAEPEEDNDNVYASPEELLCIAHLVSSMTKYVTEDAGSMTGRLEVM
jgi:hypothetical protein